MLSIPARLQKLGTDSQSKIGPDIFIKNRAHTNLELLVFITNHVWILPKVFGH